MTSYSLFRAVGVLITLILLLVLIQSSTAISQTSTSEDPIRKLLTERRFGECDDYTFNGRRLIPRLHTEGKLDSADLVSQYIRDHCKTDPFATYRFLRMAEAGEHSRIWCDTVRAQEMLGLGGRRYFTEMSMDFISVSAGRGMTFSVMDTSEFGRFMVEYSRKVESQIDSTSFVHAMLLSIFGERDRWMSNLARGQYAGTCLQQYYDHLVDSLLEKRKDFTNNWSLNIGTWIPSGKLNTLGPKIEVGGQAGLRARRIGADVTLLMRFLAAKDEYVVRHNERLYSSGHFLGFYLGVDPNIAIYSSDAGKLEVFAGLGWDGIEALSTGDTDDDKPEYLNSYNVNIGFTQRFFYGNRHNSYFAIQMRYNIVDYYTHGGSDLSGNSISINLLWGHFGHGWTDYELENLKYFDR